MKRKENSVPSSILTAAFVAIITFIIYLPALQNEFVNWDDNAYVYKNSFIISLNAKFFTSAFGGVHASYWHPLTWISHALDYALWGLNPLGHHLTNILLHAFTTFMAVFLAIRLMEFSQKTVTDNRSSKSFLNDRTILIAGAVTGLLFGLHPLHVESVAWVSERKDLLCALFFLSSIMMYTRYVSSANNDIVQGMPPSRCFDKHYLMALGFFILALLSKPMAVSLPCVLLILDWYPFQRVRSLKTLGTAFFEKLPFMALSLVISILTILAQKTIGAVMPVEVAPLSTRALVAAKSLIAYIGKIIVPLNLVPFYPYPGDVSLLSPGYLLPVVLLIGITIVCAVVVKRQKLWLSVWSYYVLTLLPVIGILQAGGQAMADRYTYLPSLGPFFIIGLVTAGTYEKAISLEWPRPLLRIAGVVVAIAALACMSYLTIQQIGIWKNSLVFWKYVIAKEPGKVPFAHSNLGVAYQSMGLFDRAIEQYQTALRLRPDYAEAYFNLGVAYQSRGLVDKAIEQYQTALRLNPDYAGAYYNLGVAYQSKGIFDRAIEQYQTAVRLNPDYTEAYYNLGVAYQSKGLFDRAIEQYQTALRLNPDYAEAHFNLGVTYKSKGLFDRAIEQYRTALRLNPDYTEAYNNLGVAYQAKGLFDRAIEQYQTVLRLSPDYAEAHYNLGLAYQSKGLFDKAIEEYQAALRLNPNYAEAHFNLGLIFLNNGAIDMARREFERGLIIKPDDYRAQRILRGIRSK